jgi:hypothetical protein
LQTLASMFKLYIFAWIMCVWVEGIYLSPLIFIFEPSPIRHMRPSLSKGFASQILLHA